MQTTVRIDTSLIEQAMTLTGFSTKKAAAEEALRHLIKLYQQKHVRELRGQLSWEGNLSEMRIGRIHVAG